MGHHEPMSLILPLLKFIFQCLTLFCSNYLSVIRLPIVLSVCFVAKYMFSSHKKYLPLKLLIQFIQLRVKVNQQEL